MDIKEGDYCYHNFGGFIVKRNQMCGNGYKGFCVYDCADATKGEFQPTDYGHYAFLRDYFTSTEEYLKEIEKQTGYSTKDALESFNNLKR